MSHEIRTPMNSIMGFMDLIDEEDLPVDQRKEYMGIVQKSCTQLLHIIDDIIEISKIDSGNIELKRSIVSINDLLKKLFNIFNIQALKVDF
jgi:signal transduction histidine kinase